VLQRSRLGQRRIIGMKNPLLPAGMPLADTRLWYRPAR
jgi:hypothetical protein